MEKSKYFSKIDCIQRINDLKKFYEKDEFRINKDKEINLLKNVLELCLKKKCPIGYYYLHGECLYG